MKEVFKKTGNEHKYGGEILKCPVCGEKESFTEHTIRLHIAACARAEIWNREMGLSKDIPHMEFYKQNTKRVRGKIVWIV